MHEGIFLAKAGDYPCGVIYARCKAHPMSRGGIGLGREHGTCHVPGTPTFCSKVTIVVPPNGSLSLEETDRYISLWQIKLENGTGALLI